MTQISFTSATGISIAVTKEPLQPGSALEPIYAGLNTAKGGLLSSGFDYPGRHSRWDIGFINPALEFIASGRSFSITALNEQGSLLLPVCP